MTDAIGRLPSLTIQRNTHQYEGISVEGDLTKVKVVIVADQLFDNKGFKHCPSPLQSLFEVLSENKKGCCLGKKNRFVWYIQDEQFKTHPLIPKKEKPAVWINQDQVSKFSLTYVQIYKANFAKLVSMYIDKTAQNSAAYNLDACGEDLDKIAEIISRVCKEILMRLPVEKVDEFKQLVNLFFVVETKKVRERFKRFVRQELLKLVEKTKSSSKVLVILVDFDCIDSLEFYRKIGEKIYFIGPKIKGTVFNEQLERLKRRDTVVEGKANH